MSFLRILLTWLLMLAVAILNGALRQLAYAPYLSDSAARRLSCLIAIVALGGVVYAVSRGWRFQSARQAWWIGLIWLVLTVLFESGMGLMRGVPWQTILSDYAIWNGQLWPVVLIFILLMPRLIFEWDGGSER